MVIFIQFVKYANPAIHHYNIDIVIILLWNNFMRYSYCLKIISWYYYITGIPPIPICVQLVLTHDMCLDIANTLETS